MEEKGLWEVEKKPPMKVFVVVESQCSEYNHDVEFVIFKSSLDAHYEFKERVERWKKERQREIEDGDYVCEERDNYFDLYEDENAINYEIEIWIEEKDVVSYF